MNEREPWIKSVFIGCRVNAHHKCSKEFVYKGERFICECECHKPVCRCGHSESEHKSLDSRPFGKWNCTFCQCKEFQKL